MMTPESPSTVLSRIYYWPTLRSFVVITEHQGRRESMHLHGMLLTSPSLIHQILFTLAGQYNGPEIILHEQIEGCLQDEHQLCHR